MSILGLIKPNSIPDSSGPSQVSETPEFLDVASSAFQATWDNFNTISRDEVISSEYERRADQYQRATGQTLGPNPWLVPWDRERLITEQKKRIEEAKVKFPDLPNDEEVFDRARKRAQQSQLDLANILREASPVTAVTGSLVGGIAGTLVDPVNLGASLMGAGAASGIVRTFLMEAAINAGAEAITQPFISRWQKDVGVEYGLSDQLTNVGLAAIAGGTIASALKFGPRAASQVFARIRSDVQMPEHVSMAFDAMERQAYISENTPLFKRELMSSTMHETAFRTAYDDLVNGRMFEPEKLDFTERQWKAAVPKDSEFIRLNENVSVENQYRAAEIGRPVLFEPLRSFDSPYRAKEFIAQTERRTGEKYAVVESNGKTWASRIVPARVLSENGDPKLYTEAEAESIAAARNSAPRPKSETEPRNATVIKVSEDKYAVVEGLPQRTIDRLEKNGRDMVYYDPISASIRKQEPQTPVSNILSPAGVRESNFTPPQVLTPAGEFRALNEKEELLSRELGVAPKSFQSYERMQEVYDGALSPDIIDREIEALRADLENSLDDKVTLDDTVVSVKDLLDQLDQDEKILTAMTGCSI